MHRPIFVQIETLSPVDIREGGRAYCEHPSFRALCLAALLPDGAFLEWRAGDDLPARIVAAVTSGAPVAMHSVDSFGRHAWRRLGFPEPVGWIDIGESAAARGLPRGFAELAASTGQARDERVRALVRAANEQFRRSPTRAPAIDAETVSAILESASLDVTTLAAVWGALQQSDNAPRVLAASAPARRSGLGTEVPRVLVALAVAAIPATGCFVCVTLARDSAPTTYPEGLDAAPDSGIADARATDASPPRKPRH